MLLWATLSFLLYLGSYQERLRDIDAQAVYFVSRYQSQTVLYTPESGERIDLVGWSYHPAGIAERTPLCVTKFAVPDPSAGGWVPRRGYRDRDSCPRDGHHATEGQRAHRQRNWAQRRGC